MTRTNRSSTRNLLRAALFNVVRGLAYGAGTMLAGAVLWLIRYCFS
ncbi:hypothetical protein ACIRS1_19475 [Kitasatospora sp. NPDC101176]